MNKYFEFIIKPFIVLYSFFVGIIMKSLEMYYTKSYENDKNKITKKHTYKIILYVDTKDEKIKFNINDMIIETNLQKSFPDTGIKIDYISYSTNKDDQLGEITYDEDDVC